jgi:cobalt-precorrin 5A hydrolase/precorrin-3B C17-methyltransferase
MTAGTVTFAGAGPGAVDLLTIRSRDAIAAADVIVYAGSLVNPEVLSFSQPHAELHDSSRMTLEETTEVLVNACRQQLRTLRLHTGDPSVYGAIAEQIAELTRAGIDYEVIPGVSAAFAAAAAVGCELTLPGSSQTVIISRRAGRTPVPAGQEIASLAKHGATMALYLSVADMAGLVADLLEGGYATETPVAVVHRASWDDQQIVQGTLADISSRVENAGIRRQALVLVGDAVAGQGERSQLYAPEFAHGFRDRTASIPFLGRVAVHALTEAGCRLGRHLADAVGGDLFASNKYAAAEDYSFEPSDLMEHLRRQFHVYDAHVFVMATGIAVRKTAALLRDKTTDPALVVCDERGRFAISLAGGHIGGANRLSKRLAVATGGTAVITTATDVQGIPAFDELAALQGWHIDNPSAIKQINSLLLERKPIAFVGPTEPVERWYGDAYPIRVMGPAEVPPADAVAIVALDAPDLNPGSLPCLRMTAQPLVVGIGCRRGTPAEVIGSAVDRALSEHPLSRQRVIAFATAEAKRGDEGLETYVRSCGAELSFYSSEQLEAVPVPSPSAMPAKHVGTHSVAEAASLLRSGGRLLVPKRIHEAQVTVAIATCPLAQHDHDAAPSRSGKIYAVGIGPGTLQSMTQQAQEALQLVDTVVGYKVYIDQVATFIKGKQVLSTGMRKEVERCNAAIDAAAEGASVAVICSGDAGVYGMAGLVLELLDARGKNDIEVEVVPGVTAALSSAALLGAPLMNDYATISLSDLLTDRQTILDRLRAIAGCGMPCVLYNPRSRKRTKLLDEAIQLFMDARGPELACGYVRNAGRDGQATWVGPIVSLRAEEVDMFTTVILGGPDTTILAGRLVTRRGYATRESV